MLQSSKFTKSKNIDQIIELNFAQFSPSSDLGLWGLNFQTQIFKPEKRGRTGLRRSPEANTRNHGVKLCAQSPSDSFQYTHYKLSILYSQHLTQIGCKLYQIIHEYRDNISWKYGEKSSLVFGEKFPYLLSFGKFVQQCHSYSSIFFIQFLDEKAI